MGAREAVMTMPDGCLALLGQRRTTPPARGTSAGRPWSRSSRSAPWARATPSWPATWPLATAGASDTECVRFGVACGAESTQHFGAGVLDPREVDRLVGEVELEMLDTPAVELPR